MVIVLVIHKLLTWFFLPVYNAAKIAGRNKCIRLASIYTDTVKADK
jgi:hypothetical protein